MGRDRRASAGRIDASRKSFQKRSFLRTSQHRYEFIGIAARSTGVVPGRSDAVAKVVRKKPHATENRNVRVFF